MKLTFKIMLLFLLVACGLLVISGYLSVQREVDFFEKEMAGRHSRLVAAVEPMLRDAWDSAGPGGMLRFVAGIEGDETQVRIRWVWLGSMVEPDVPRPVASLQRLQQIPVGQMASLRVRLPGGEQLYCSYFPVELGDGRRGALEMAESMSRLDAYLQSTILRTVMLMGAMIVSAMLVVALAGLRMIGHPLEALIQKTRQVADGDLKTPVIVGGSDELALLATALNQMCDKLDASQQEVQRESARRIEALDQLRHDDRLKTVGKLASGVAHELGTPLNVVGGRAGLIAGGQLTQDDIIKSARTIQAEASRMTQIVQQLLNFARRSTPRRSSCQLSAVIERTVDLMEPFIRKHHGHVHMTDRLDPNMTLQADAGQLQQVLSNLLTNALLSRDGDVEVQISAEACQAVPPDQPGSTPRSMVRISVRDNGDGISQNDLPHIFEPFFTTRDVGQGTGLGLSIAHGLVAEHGGWMSADSSPGIGTTMSVFLPVETVQ